MHHINDHRSDHRQPQCALSATSELSPGRATIPHLCPATRAWTSDYWNGADHCLQRHLVMIDYCNSLLYGAPIAVVEKLQRAQNNVDRVICQQRRCVHARPLLQSLHWLPVQQRIQYEIAVIMRKALLTSVPPYIDELLQRQVTTRSLRSTDAPRLSVPWTRTETAKRAFCVAVPNVWSHYRMTYTSCHRCQRSVPNRKHTF